MNMSTTMMHGCHVIVSNWDIDLRRGRRLQRERRLTFDRGSVDRTEDSMAGLLMDTNCAFAVLNTPGYNSDSDDPETSTSSPEDSASFSSGDLSSLSDFSVDTPPTVYSPVRNHGAYRRAGWRHLSGKSRAPSTWPGKQTHHASPSCVGRFVRAARNALQGVSTGKVASATKSIFEKLPQLPSFGKGEKAA